MVSVISLYAQHLQKSKLPKLKRVMLKSMFKSIYIYTYTVIYIHITVYIKSFSYILSYFHYIVYIQIIDYAHYI